MEFEGQSLKYSMNMLQNEVKTENHKTAVMLRDPTGGLFVGERSVC